MNDFIETFGPSAKWSEHKPGDTVTYLLDGETHTGEILHVVSPGTTVSGKDRPTLYIVEAGDSFPRFVAPSEVVAAAASN